MRIIDKVAERAGVSVATVSRTFRSPEKLREETAARILSIATEMGYAPKPRRPRRRTLESEKRSTIGYLFFAAHARELFTSNAFYGEILAGAKDEAERLKLSVEVEVASKFAPPESLPEMLRPGKVDGVLLVGAAPVSVLSFYSSTGHPLVNVDHVDPRGLHDSVLSDGIDSAYAILDHLWELGHRRIAFVRPISEAVTFAERFRGYRIFLDEHDCAFDPSLVLKVGSYEEIVAGAGELITSRAAPTAIFAVNDETASMVLHACHDKGVKVPESVSVAGFDDTSLAQRVWPPLTTVRVDTEEMGREAVRRLYELMKPRDGVERSASRPPLCTRLNGHLVPRRSTGPVRSDEVLPHT